LTLLSVVLRHLTRRSARTLLTVLGIALSSGACFAVTGLMQSFERSMIESLDDTGTDFVVAPRGAFSLAGSSMPQDIVAKIAAVPAVATATGILMTMMTIDGSQNQAVLGRPADTFGAMRVRRIEGRLPPENAADDVILGDRMAQHLGKKVGDTLEIDYVPFRVSAIIEFDTYMNRSLIIVPLQQLQRLAQRQTTLSFVEVRLKRPFVDGTPAASRAAVARAAAPYDVMDAQDFVKSMHLNKIIRAVSNAVAAIMLLITVMIVANTMLMSVGERTYEFGVLTAIGWRRGAIMAIVMAEALLLTAGGGFLGLLIGSFAITTASEVPQQPVFGLPIHPIAAGQIFLAVLAAGLIGAAYPARKTLRLNAVDALRRA
jgi:putative ABC transport system permease protein